MPETPESFKVPSAEVPVVLGHENTSQTTKEHLVGLKLQTEVQQKIISWSQQQSVTFDPVEQAEVNTGKERIFENMLKQLPESERVIFLEEMIDQTKGRTPGKILSTERMSESELRVALHDRGNGGVSFRYEFVYDSTENQIHTMREWNSNIRKSLSNIEHAIDQIGGNVLQGGQMTYDQRRTIEMTLRHFPKEERISFLEDAAKGASSMMDGAGRIIVQRPNERQTLLEFIDIDENGVESKPLASIVYDQRNNSIRMFTK